MTLGELIDKNLVKAKGLAPYLICLASIALGLAIFNSGASQATAFPWAATVMTWTGVLLTLLGTAMLIAWHFFQYPNWFQIGKPRAQKPATPARRQANDRA